MTLTSTLTSTATLTSTLSLTLHLDPHATQPSGPVVDNWAMLSFQRLEVYQRSIEFLALALGIIAELPTKGHADIADQLRRAAQSQPLNIAEGAAGRRALTSRSTTRSLGAPRWSAPRSST